MSYPLRICTSTEMRKLDQIAEQEYAIPPEILMENAGRAAVQILFEHYPQAGKRSEILVFAGKGNNAGDAFVVARRLICLERRVRIFHVIDESEYRGATKKNFEILKRMKAKMTLLDSGAELESFFNSSSGPFLAIDGILGTGLKGKLHGIFYDLAEIINRYVQDVVALDIPTGVNGDTGAVESIAVQAALTLSFGFPKIGHFLPPGAAFRGKLVNVDISLPPRFRKEGDKFLLMRGPISKMLIERDRYAHKNSFGHTFLLGGSEGRLGAICMAAAACQAIGTGLTTVMTWPEFHEALSFKLSNESMSGPIKLSGPEYEDYVKKLHFCSSIVVGPGLGKRPEGKTLMEQVLMNYQGPIVIDADALNIIGEHKLHDHIAKRKSPTVLTPHPGEMARLIGWTKEKVIENPINAIEQAVSLTHAVVLLKGATTLIAAPGHSLYLNHYPNDGMATAGSGDVLAGMIGGLLGQKMDAIDATFLGVFLHSLAGDFAAREKGHRSMTAQDIIENIGNAFKDIKKPYETDFPEEGRAELL